MTSLADWRPPRVRRQDWAWSSIRPVTLLIASGIVLVAAILVLTGLVAGHLREQALDAAQVEMGRLDAVVAAGAERSFAASDTVLKTLSGRLGRGETPFADGAMPAETAATLETGLGPISPFSAIAAFGPDGSLAEAAGWWPSGAVNLADRDFFARLRAQPLLDTAIGGGLVDSRNGATLIPFARRVRGETGDTLGYLVGLMPRSDLESFLRAVPLGPGSAIALTRQDGLMLASYPAEASLAAELEAVRPLPGYPLNIAIARNGGAALGEWSRQAALLGALALLGAIGVAVMVAMIARQFRIHAALAEVRAEKIEVERARLVTEAELLKKERLSVLGQLTATVAHELRNPLSAIRNTLFTRQGDGQRRRAQARPPDQPHGAQHRAVRPDYRRPARIHAAARAAPRLGRFRPPGSRKSWPNSRCRRRSRWSTRFRRRRAARSRSTATASAGS